MKTKDAIVDKARELFNERGSARVSTNHIAAALGISPGNLYYHYRNKAEIVRTLFHQFEVASDSAWQEATISSLAELERLLDRHFEVIAPFDFLGRELAALIRNDPELRERVADFLRRREAQLSVVLNGVDANGSRNGNGSAEAANGCRSERARLMASLLVLWPAHATVGRAAEPPSRVLRSLAAGL